MPAATIAALRARIVQLERQDRAVFDSIVDFGIVVMDLTGCVADWNIGAEEVLGWTREEMIGESASCFFTPEDRAAGRVETEMRLALKNGRASDERWHLKKGGQRFWASGELMPLYGDDGAHVGYTKVVRDRTAEHLAGRALAESEARLRRAQEIGGVGLFTVDLSDNVLKPTPEFCRIYGLPVRDAYPAEVIEALIIPEDKHLMSTAASRSAGQVIREVQYRVRHPETGEVRWVARTGDLERSEEGRPIRFVGAARDVTEQRGAQDALHAAARRQDALIELGDRLRDLDSVQGMTLAASEILGRTLDVMLVGYGDVDPGRESIAVVEDWTTRGAQSLAGTLSFSDLGPTIEDLRRGETVVVADAAEDPRTRNFSAPQEDWSARAFVHTPLFERGAFVGLLYVSTARARTWSTDELAFIREAADRLRLGIARVRAEAERAVLNQELSHRLKNTLAMVQSISRQTLRAVPDQTPVQAFDQRVLALSKAHDILLQQSWSSAEMDVVLRSVLGSIAPLDRFDIQGVEVRLGARSTLALSMLLHELATNAQKHGSLSDEGGRVIISWVIKGIDDDARLVLTWLEAGGPPAIEPARKGFGSRLMAAGLTGTGGADLRYTPEGLKAVFWAPVRDIGQS